MFSIREASIIAIAEATVGLSAAVASWRAFRATALKVKRKEASARLRRAFAPEISLLRKVPGQSSNRLLSDEWEIVEILAEAFPRHAKAVEEYRAYVPESQLAGFEQARRDYFGQEGTIRLLDYVNENSRALVLSRMSAVLQFTDE